MTTTPERRPSLDLPYVETEHEQVARLGRVAGRLVCAVWAMAIVGALLGAVALPAGSAALTVCGTGMLGGALLSVRRPARRGRAGRQVLAATVTLNATAAAVVLDGTGAVALGAFVLAAVYAGATLRPPVVAGLHLLVATCAPVAVALLPGRAAEALPTALGLAPGILAVGVLAAVLREQAIRREHAYRALARRDPLTGVGNYRRLHERLAETVARDPQRFALLTMDVDSFKAVNDRYGHLEGDRLLREVGRALVDNVRGKDVVARQGGDEFAVLAPETDEHGAQLLAARIERALQEIRVEDRAEVRASIGIAVYPQDGTTVEELLARSDDALRLQKSTRRKPVVPV